MCRWLRSEHITRDNLVQRGFGVKPSPVLLFLGSDVDVDVASEPDFGDVTKDAAEIFQLVIDQRVHWIKEQGMNTWFRVSKDLRKDRSEEGKRFAAAGAAGDDDIAAGGTRVRWHAPGAGKADESKGQVREGDEPEAAGFLCQ